VLAQEPDNGEALEGLQRIGSVIDARLQTALADRQFDEAAASLAQLRRVRPDDPAIPATEARIAESRIAAAVEGGNLERAAQLLRESISAGNLPEDRAARWRADLERRQADAKAKRDAAEADRRAADARAAAASPTGAADAARAPTVTAPPKLSARESAPSAAQPPETALASERPQSPGVANAATERAPAPATDAPAARAVTAADFKRTRYVQPVYPKEALDKGLRGEVRVRITVDTEGRVKQVDVMESNPPGVFDSAAIAAVQRWRFKPIKAGGQAVEASAVTTMIFQPDDGPGR
jgi:protein TonB